MSADQERWTKIATKLFSRVNQNNITNNQRRELLAQALADAYEAGRREGYTRTQAERKLIAMLLAQKEREG